MEQGDAGRIHDVNDIGTGVQAVMSVALPAVNFSGHTWTDGMST